MPQRLQRSLKHEYDVYVEQEIENYKFSLARSALLRIGDEAVTNLRSQTQPEFNELVLWSEVDRIIRDRLRIPSFQTWRRRRVRLLAQYRRPEHWGLAADAPLVREIVPLEDSNVLVAGINQEGPVLYLAAHGCQVTALDDNEEAVERVVNAAGQVGLMPLVRGQSMGLGSWAPDSPLTAVVVNSAALQGLTPEQRTRVIDALQRATIEGGVHLVETHPETGSQLTLEELQAGYRGWTVSIDPAGQARTFLARKVA